MKKFIWDQKRWFPLIAYLFLALIIWNKRTTLIYSHLPAFFGRQGILLCDLILVALVFSLFTCVFYETRCPFWIKIRVDRAFQQAGLKNGLGEYPTLAAVTKDLRKKNGRRYTVKNVGVSIESMEQKKDSLQREIGIVYELSDSPKPRYTYLYVAPGKASLLTQMPIVYDNDF